MCDVFPHLDVNTYYSSEGRAFVAGIHTANDLIKPRCYVHKSNAETLLFDGVAIDTSAKFRAFDAKQLARHWATLPDVLEGQFCVARVLSNPDSIEVMVDALGMYQLYYINMPDGVLLSNSVELINRISGDCSLDIIGATYFLGLGWVAGDRTLRNGVRVIQPGEIWRWQTDCSEPQRKTYFHLGDYSSLQKQDFSTTEAKSLAQELSSIVSGLSAYEAVVECPITAGRDSRLLTALITHNSIRANYFTTGPVSSPDVIVGSRIASVLDLPHHVGGSEILGDDSILPQWDAASQRLLRQTDGMVTLAHAGNALHPEQIDRFNIELYGAAGEIARPFFPKNNPLYYIFKHRPAYFNDKIIKSVITPREGLLHADVGESARKYVRDFTRDAIDMGFSTKDLGAVFYTLERARRWAGTHMRTITSYIDVFVPLATRPYVKAAFSVPAYQRYSERIPKELLHYLAPELDSISFDHPWRPQTAYGQLMEYYLRRYHYSIPGRAVRKLYRIATNTKYRPKHTGSKSDLRSQLIEARLNDFRSLCLDQTDTPLWELVNRKKLESLLSTSTGAQERRRNMDVLYDIFTLFQYTSAEFQVL
jgi:asparagine synthase (glutamine-hydrolysing)